MGVRNGREYVNNKNSIKFPREKESWFPRAILQKGSKLPHLQKIYLILFPQSLEDGTYNNYKLTAIYVASIASSHIFLLAIDLGLLLPPRLEAGQQLRESK